MCVSLRVREHVCVWVRARAWTCECVHGNAFVCACLYVCRYTNVHLCIPNVISIWLHSPAKTYTLATSIAEWILWVSRNKYKKLIDQLIHVPPLFGLLLYPWLLAFFSHILRVAQFLSEKPASPSHPDKQGLKGTFKNFLLKHTKLPCNCKLYPS